MDGWMSVRLSGCLSVWFCMHGWIIVPRCVRTTVDNIRTVQQKTGGSEELKPRWGQTNGKTQLAASKFACPEAAAVCLCIWLIRVASITNMDKHGDQMIKTYQSRTISVWSQCDISVTAIWQKLSPSSGGQMPWCWATSVEACGSSFAVSARPTKSRKHGRATS